MIAEERGIKKNAVKEDAPTQRIYDPLRFHSSL